MHIREFLSWCKYQPENVLLNQLPDKYTLLMKVKIYLALAFLILQIKGIAQGSFTAGNIVVYRVGTGPASLGNGATAVFLDEYTTAGVLVQSIALPTTTSGANKALTATGRGDTEGM